MINHKTKEKEQQHQLEVTLTQLEVTLTQLEVTLTQLEMTLTQLEVTLTQLEVTIKPRAPKTLPCTTNTTKKPLTA